MSVVGIDLGNLNTVIAVARNRGIDVICNEVSNRATPTLVAFGFKNRFIGEAAKSQEISNLKNTIGCFKRLIGRRNVPQEELEFLSYRTETSESNVYAKVTYLGEEQRFTPTELCAMFLSKMKEITCAELQSQSVSDIVLSCPVYFTDTQRRALMDAVEIAGLKCQRLLNETTAAALAYGMTKASDMSDDVAKNVCFVDIGHSNTSIAIVSFWKSRMEVKAVAFDSSLGGRNFDELLVQCIADDIKETRKVDVRSSPKAMYRLRTAAERAKKILSANSKTAIHVESIAEDQDFATDFTRERFEQIIVDLLDRLEIPIRKALVDSSLAVDAIHNVELIGGSVRVPSIKERIAKIFQQEPGSTMNQDEAVARGCALQAAMLSPTFKSRPYTIQDAVVQDIRMCWEPTIEEPEDREAIVFPACNSLPSTKLLSFSRTLPFEISCSSPHTNEVFGAAAIGTTGMTVPPQAIIKVKAKMSLCHTVTIESAQIYEESVVEGSGEEEGKQRKVQKKTDVPVVYVHTGMNQQRLEQLKEAECQMAAHDRLVRDTEHSRNALEEYIYSCRSKLGNEWRDLALDQEKANFISKMDSSESWLYSDDGSDSTKSVYQSKLNELKAIGDPIAKRYIEEEGRPRTIARLRDQVANYLAFAEDKSIKYQHIGEDDRSTVRKACADADANLANLLNKQSSLKPWDKPAITNAQIDLERDKLINLVTPIMLKPKPTPTPPTSTASSAPKPEHQAEQQAASEGPLNEIPDLDMD